MVKKSNRNKYLIFFIILIILLGVFSIVKPSFMLSPPSLSELMSRADTYSSTLDSLQEEFNEKKENYQACVTSLVQLQVDFLSDAYDADAQREQLSAEYERCSDLYSQVTSRFDSSVNAPLLELDAKFISLINSLDELHTELLIAHLSLIDSGADRTLLDASLNEMQTLIEFKRQVEERKQAVVDFYYLTISLRDPSTAMGSRGVVLPSENEYGDENFLNTP